MLRAWRRATVVALAAGAAITASLTAGAATSAAQAAAPAVSIAATAKLKPVTGDVFVVYRAGAYSTAKIHGTITGAAAGDIAILYAQPFPYKKPAAAAGSVTLKGATAAYSFTVTPALATHYAVRLFASGTPAPVAVSRTQAVYLTNAQTYSSFQTCKRPVCHETFRIYTYVPSSSLAFEMRKHVYPYFGLNLSNTGTPPPPKWLILDGGHAKVTNARRVAADEFVNTLSFTFTIGNHGYYWIPGICTKDAVTTDGIGLPGRHSCGAHRISTSLPYVG
jgi:hypothetical protein